MRGFAQRSASPVQRRISSRSSDAIARAARSASAAPDNTAQDWAIESIRHSSSVLVPSQPPSSNVARRYQAPSQASRSSASRTVSAFARQRAACAGSRLSASGANSAMVRRSSDPSRTLSPWPCSPTRFMPSRSRPPYRSAAGRARRSDRGTGRARGRSARRAMPSRPPRIGRRTRHERPAAPADPRGTAPGHRARPRRQRTGRRRRRHRPARDLF